MAVTVPSSSSSLFSFTSSSGVPTCVTHKPHFQYFLPPYSSGWRESWETKANSPISPSPCRFGWGLVSSRCQSAIWSPPPADSCKATHVRAIRTKWCWEERLSVGQQKPLITHKFLTLKNQQEESPFEVIDDLTLQMRKVKTSASPRLFSYSLCIMFERYKNSSL